MRQLQKGIKKLIGAKDSVLSDPAVYIIENRLIQFNNVNPNYSIPLARN
ncbi:hypothetical protein N9F08_01290 [bacterium]|nr:hypothetical protein [bacterium]